MQKRIKLYLAVLNKGWIRRELVHTLLEMRDTKGVKITLENLNKTFANPICSNRNSITKRFLATDNEFLMMIDNDVLPLHNPAELVFADKDVIGSPAKVRQRGRNINWVAYVKIPDETAYIPVDFQNVDDTVDLLSVDIVGTGCILIKRKVLESIKAPFLTEFNEDGISSYGTDFAFCKRVKKAGFEIYTTPQRICEHVKEVGLLDIQGYDDCDGRDAIAGKYAIPWGENTITQNDWYFIKGIIEKNTVRTVLEFGSGLSSLLMSEITEVDSLEPDEKWRNRVVSKIDSGKNMLNIMKWDGQKIDKSLLRHEYDLAFISELEEKERSFEIATKLAPRLIVYNAGKRQEQWLQRKYLRNKYRLMEKNGWHLQRCHYWELRGKKEVLFKDYDKRIWIDTSLKDNDVISRGFLDCGNFYERPLLDFAGQLKLDENKAIVDVGANVGNHTMFFSLFCSCSRVFAFEPYDKVRSVLERHVEMNKLSNVKIPPHAVGGKAGFCDLEESPMDILGIRRRDGGTYVKKGGSIKMVTLDSVLKNESISLIKIDVEGYEYDVLHGAKNILKTQHPYVFVEAKTPDAKARIDKYLFPLGYKHERVFGHPSPTHFYAHDWKESEEKK